MIEKRKSATETPKSTETTTDNLVVSPVDPGPLGPDVGSSRSNDAKKYQIFVSSTFTDLIEERRAVTEVILSMGHIPVGMELFEAGNEDQWSYIKNRILEVDYYLLIVAERYGSAGPDGTSYTEMEYRYAVEQELPVAALLLDPARREQWPAGKIDFENRERLNAFRKLCQNRMVAYWSDAGTLTTRCQLALSGLFRRHPRAGWVSGDRAVSPQLASELARLSSENAELRFQLAQLQRDGTTSKELDVTVGRLIEPFLTEIQRASRRYPATPYARMVKDQAVSQSLSNCNLFDLIMTSPGEFFDGFQDDRAYKKISAYVMMKIWEIEEKSEDSAETVGNPVAGVMTLLIRSWGLVEIFFVDRPQGSPEKWLRLSPLGRRAFDAALGQFLDGT
jgi:hypothetical protein